LRIEKVTMIRGERRAAQLAALVWLGWDEFGGRTSLVRDAPQSGRR
jgi:hypothetical protein